MRAGVVFSDFNEQEPDAGTAGGYSDEWNGSCVKEEIIIKIFKICDESLICVTYLFLARKINPLLCRCVPKQL